MQLTGWRAPTIGFFAGALAALALPPLFVIAAPFLAFPALLMLIEAAGSTVTAARRGWWFGFGYFVIGLYWIGEAFLVEAEVFLWLLPFAVTLLPAGLAIFFGVAYCVGAERFPKITLWQGVAFGVVVYVVFHVIVMPGLGTVPAPWHQPWRPHGAAVAGPGACRTPGRPCRRGNGSYRRCTRPRGCGGGGSGRSPRDPRVASPLRETALPAPPRSV